MQLEFGSWPDYGVPHAAGLVAALICRVDELRAETAGWTTASEADETEPPLLVHCAGGVGRTGSFITAHSLHCQQQAGATVPVEDVAERVDLLRRQRHPYVVETAAQLALIVDVLSHNEVSQRRQ